MWGALLLCLGLLGAFLAYCVLPLAHPGTFRAWFQAQQARGAVDLAQHPLFPPLVFYYSQTASRFVYLASRLLWPSATTFGADWQPRFVAFLLRAFTPLAGEAAAGPPQLTLRSLCQTLAPAAGDFGDAAKMAAAVQVPGQVPGTWPTDAAGWRALMRAAPDVGGWGLAAFTDTTWDTPTMAPLYTRSPTNFLWQVYRIPCDCLALQHFLRQTPQEVGLFPLLGLVEPGSAGGWWGYCQLDLFRAGGLPKALSFLWVDTFPQAPAAPKPSCAMTAVQAATAGVASGMQAFGLAQGGASLAVAVGLAPETGGLSVAAPFLIGLVAAAVGVGQAFAAGAGSC